MASIKITSFLIICLVSVALAAPAAETESAPTTTVATPTPITTTTSAPAQSTEASPSSTTTTGSAASPESSSSTPVTTTASSSDAAVPSSTPPMAVASASEGQAPKLNTTFTCFDRQVGYYADIQMKCRVYHFCLPGEFNKEKVFQRVSYLCINETVFDQQALDCVAEPKLSAPCADSEKYYDGSNQVLRQAIVAE